MLQSAFGATAQHYAIESRDLHCAHTTNNKQQLRTTNNNISFLPARAAPSMYHQHIVSSTGLSHWEYVPKGRVGKSGGPTSPMFAPPAALQAQQAPQYSHQPSLCTNGHADRKSTRLNSSH